MRKDTKLYKFLEFLYLKKDKKVTSKEISEGTGIRRTWIRIYFNRTIRHVRREIINGEFHYNLKPEQVSRIKAILENAT